MLQVTRHDIPAALTFAVESHPAGRQLTSLIGPAALAAALAALVFFGLAAKDGGWLAGLSAAAFAITMVLGLVCQRHARASRRLTAALDSYANQEIARAQRSKVGK